MHVCYLGIGSNLGNRRENIKLALRKINRLKDTKVIKVSKIIETKPVGAPSRQEKFLNAAAKIETNLAPVVLLNKLQCIEVELGRAKRHRRYGPRTIDLDILLYGEKLVNRKNLIIPHPRLFEREFVLKPLAQII